MKQVDQKTLIVAPVAMTIVLSGCQTTNDTWRDSTFTQVGVSAAVGTAVGVLVNSAVGSAVASALAGLATAAITNYESRAGEIDRRGKAYLWSNHTDQQAPGQDSKRHNSPKWVKVGEKAAIWTTYWLNLPPGESTASATESWMIKSKGIPPVMLGPTHGERTGGKRGQRWVSRF